MRSVQEILNKYWGPLAFRFPQGEIIAALTQGQDVMVVLPTGEGKSLCFQVAGLVLGGLTVVISPLLALMGDQVQQLNQRGLQAAFLHGELGRSEVQAIHQAIQQQTLQFLYLAPEQLHNPALLRVFTSYPPSFVIIDEAHCISLWGHDFRPAYRLIAPFVEKLGKRPVIAAFTATATTLLREDIRQNLGIPQATLFLGSALRENVSLQVQGFWTPLGKWQALLKTLRTCPKTLIYATTRREIEALAERLKKTLKRPDLCCYHAGLAMSQREAAYHYFKEKEQAILIASKAFGMGIDIPDIHTVIHWGLPEGLEAYVQEVGRVARNRAFEGRGLLLRVYGEKSLQQTLHTKQGITAEQVRLFWQGLKKNPSVLRLQDQLNLSPTQLNLLVGKLLAYGLIQAGRAFEYDVCQDKLPADQLKHLLHELKALQVQREQQFKQLAKYTRNWGCRRQFIDRYFGLEQTAPCGRCDRCRK